MKIIKDFIPDEDKLTALRVINRLKVGKEDIFNKEIFKEIGIYDRIGKDLFIVIDQNTDKNYRKGKEFICDITGETYTAFHTHEKALIKTAANVKILPICSCCGELYETTKLYRLFAKDNTEHYCSKSCAITITNKKNSYTISCDECKDKECNFRNRVELNRFNNNTCLTKSNNIQSKRELAAKRLSNLWKDENFRSKSGKRFDICHIHGKTEFNGNKCILCYPEANSGGGKKINFKIENDKILYYDRTELDYVLWDEFKEKFKTQNVSFLETITKDYKDSFLQTTFRTQDSENWNGAEAAFEQSLVENNIEWFSYIKFYIDKENNIKPLVVGKTGSKLVNISGSDIIFSYEIGDGPSRRFLLENNLDWCKTQVLIIPAKDENDAYKIELEIIKNYNLFGS